MYHAGAGGGAGARVGVSRGSGCRVLSRTRTLVCTRIRTRTRTRIRTGIRHPDRGTRTRALHCPARIVGFGPVARPDCRTCPVNPRPILPSPTGLGSRGRARHSNCRSRRRLIADSIVPGCALSRPSLGSQGCTAGGRNTATATAMASRRCLRGKEQATLRWLAHMSSEAGSNTRVQLS